MIRDGRVSLVSMIAIGWAVLAPAARPATAPAPATAADDGRAARSVVPPPGAGQKADPADRPADVMSPAQWKQVDRTVDRALRWLATRQQPDGSFKSPPSGQPAITALTVMAFMSRGHLPGQGPYGQQLDKALRFILSCQKADGLICHENPKPPRINYAASHTAIYNHAISALCLSELYGMTDTRLAPRVRKTIVKALQFTRSRQRGRKRNPLARGGWRYLYANPGDQAESDLSVASWQLLLMRSAKNAGFRVPAADVASAVAYVKRCFDPRLGTFLYHCEEGRREVTRAMAGAGILSLSLAGEHDTAMAKAAARRLLKAPFTRYNVPPSSRYSGHDRYHYAVFYASLGLFHLGGQPWKSFYPPTAMTLVRNQRRDGSYELEHYNNRYFGNTYTTALVVIALNVPNQVLPIMQR